MPTHWESSERPLFVRTVVVNGSRHAILSHVDPLCQARKSDSSPEGMEPNREDVHSRRVRSCYPSKRDISSELQNCLVKLRVVLSTQEQRRRLKKEVLENEGTSENWKRVRRSIEMSQKSGRDELSGKNVKQEDITGFRRGNRYRSATRKSDCEDTDGSNKGLHPLEPDIEPPVNEVTKTSERANLIRTVLPISEATEELLRKYSSYFLPIVYIKADDLAWEDVAEESTVPRNVHNPLSERVMQWLDLARRRKENLNIDKLKAVQLTTQTNRLNTDDKTENKQKPTRCRSKSSFNKNIYQSPDEDVEDEVKHESDIETVLSSTSTHEYPKYSRELNKLHIMKSDSPVKQTDGACPVEDCWENILSIPEKTTSDYTLTEQLQQSILESFEAIVNLERKAALERTERIHSSRKKEVRYSSGRVSRKKSLLMKQTTIRISSDEEDTPESALMRRRTQKIGKRSGYFNGKHSWKYRGQRVMSANDENLEPSDESGREVRITYNDTPLRVSESRGGRRIWATEKGANKLHLHIFMPGINPKFLEAHEESASDAESTVK